MITHRLRQTYHRLRDGDREFLRGAAILSVGIILARLLGIGYSLTLAAVFPAEDYGMVRYGITLGMLTAIITQPFGQHVIARFIGKYRQDPASLQPILSSSWLILALLVLLTLLFIVPIVQYVGMMNLGIFAVFAGTTIFYTYWGICRGYAASTHLAVAYFFSNLCQLILVLVLFYGWGNSSPTVALLIYGGSYLIPLALLQLFYPLPLHAKRQGATSKLRWQEISLFFMPVLASHVVFKLNESLPTLLLERYAGFTAIGIYSVANTLALVFAFIPSSIATLIMPKAAANSPEQNQRIMRQTLALILSMNAVGFVIYMLLSRWFVEALFGPEYVVDLSIYAITALTSIATGTFGVMVAIIVGAGQAQVETLSRLAGFLVTAVCGFLFIPTYGIQGAALTSLFSTLIAIAVVILAARWWRTT
jgi:O-antigen/teichoic acid export membrane protein